MNTTAKSIATIDEPAVPMARQAITPMEMLQIAVEKGATVEQLERLMALQERFEANEARKAFVVAKAAFKAEAPQIEKNKHVSFGKAGGSGTEYDHATLDNIVDTIGPTLSAHGLTHSWETHQSDGLIEVTCVLTHVKGHSERVTLKAGADNSGSKNNIQAIGSAVTYLQRYTLLAVTGMATGSPDDDGAGTGSIEYVSEKQVGDLQALCEEVGADRVKFLKFMGAPSFDKLPAAQYSNAVAQLQKKRNAK